LGEFVKAAETLETNENTFLVVTTPKHKYDEEVTGILAAKSFKYLGMIGSKKKVALAIQNYKKRKTLTDTQIQNINMPIGIPFNAQTPEEIAVSILAKLIDVKNS
jgi:xanthine dehydrogenase accessory factor